MQRGYVNKNDSYLQVRSIRKLDAAIIDGADGSTNGNYADFDEWMDHGRVGVPAAAAAPGMRCSSDAGAGS